ncbi:hypothetical protein FRC17_005478, partial [Serendipita sp. 399]
MSAIYSSDVAYSGEEKIVIAMDIGTTHTGVSFVHCYPGERPKVNLVTRWPGQATASGAAKIPTFVVYEGSRWITCGQEADAYLDDDSCEIIRWFKLHLHGESLKQSDQPPKYGSHSNFSSRLEIPDLPNGLSVERVYVDFMKYLLNQAQKFFEDHISNGEAIWRRLRPRMEFVLATPNGWDITQQSFLRRAAIAAEWVTTSNAGTSIKFVTEGEASVHYVLAYSPSKTWLSVGTVFAVIDAGGSTVDSTLYRCKALEPDLQLEEVCGSECVQEEVAQTFDNVIAGIAESCQRLIRGRRVEHILLVGGFGESPYLKKRLSDIFSKQGAQVVTVEQPSEGAAIWYIKRLVKARAARFTLGTISSSAVHRAEHLERIGSAFVDSDGLLTVRHTFTTLVKKDQVLDDDYTHTGSFAAVFSLIEMLFIPESVTRKMDIYAWEGEGDAPVWARDKEGEELTPGLRLLCTLEGKMPRLKESMKLMTGPGGRKYLQSDLRVLIYLGGTELTARLQWTEG